MALVLILLTVFLGLSFAQLEDRECFDQVRSYHQCLSNSSIPPPPPPNFAKIRTEIEACYTTSGCSPPKPPPPPPLPGQAGSNNTGLAPSLIQANNSAFQCFHSIIEKTRGEFVSCMKSKDPNFGSHLPASPPPGGPPPPPGGGPPPLPPPPPPGANGAPPPPPPQADHPPHPPPIIIPHPDHVLPLCNGDASKASQLTKCISDAINNNKPSKDDVKVHYDAMCKADAECNHKIGDACQEKIAKKHQILCECNQQVGEKGEEAFKAEPACSEVKLPPPRTEKHDCSKPPSPCAEGFEVFYNHTVAHSMPPPPPPVHP